MQNPLVKGAEMGLKRFISHVTFESLKGTYKSLKSKWEAHLDAKKDELNNKNKDELNFNTENQDTKQKCRIHEDT